MTAACSPGSQAQERLYSASERVVVGPLCERFEDDVLSANALSRDIVDQSRVKQLFTEHLSGAITRYALWAVWMLERWARLDLAAN